VFDAINDRVNDARRAVHDVERRMKSMLLPLRSRYAPGLRPSPSGVHGIHVNAGGVIVRRAGARHHVERGLAIFVCGCRVVLNFR